MKKAVIVFTRAPIPGQTKTRLIPYLGEKKSAALHLCFLCDIALQIKKADADIFVCYTPRTEKGKLKKVFGEEAVYFPQAGAGLGEKMQNAIETVLQKGCEACVLFGTDIPELSVDDIRAAFAVLKKKDVVFGPSQDGGYYLVGMKKLCKEIFTGHSYGHGEVLEQAVESLEVSGFSVGRIRMLADMDEKEDLAGYRNRMRGCPRMRHTFTGRYLAKISRISIIIPVYNEETTVVQMQKQLMKLKDKCEVLFVDGGSTDHTLELISPCFRVLHSQKGRAWQMNLGAKESTGDILFFLHCDSELPSNPLAEIRAVTAKYRAGCFGIRFRSKKFFLWTCCVMSNCRARDRKVMFGDQGIFLDRELFFEAGMFPELPIMEDYQFSLTLKKMGIKLGMTRHRLYTSDRRFPPDMIPMLREMWKMNRLRKMYRDGKPIEFISGFYRDVR